MAWVVLVFLWVLGRTLLQQAHPRFFFLGLILFKLNGCYLTATNAYCLTFKINSYGRDMEIN